MTSACRAGIPPHERPPARDGLLAAGVAHTGRISGNTDVSTVTIVSLFAATLSMVSFVPQAWTIIRSRNTEGISLRMYLITVAGFLAWLLYGALLMQWAIIVQNVICLGLSSFILTMKLLPQRQKEVVADKIVAVTPMLDADRSD